MLRTLVAIPVYNEARHVQSVLSRVRELGHDILVVDDGSTDATPSLLARESGIAVERHPVNTGYGSSLRDCFLYAIDRRYDLLITMDCDDQHEPREVPAFIAAAREDDADIISGSRYLAPITGNDTPPRDRRRVNEIITREINERLGASLALEMTDSFCGFKAHRVDALAKLNITETGYAFPMQLWAQAAAERLRVRELPVRLIYNDLTRSFGGTLDDPDRRLAHYRSVLHREIIRLRDRLPAIACAGLEIPRACKVRGACCM